MIGKKINQLATELAPESTDLTIIGDPTTGVSKKITLAQLGAIFSGAVSFYNDLASFPATGDINVIYCAKDTQKLYLWSGSAYVEVFPSQALLDTYQLRSEKGNANGYASLDSQGKVPITQLPSSIMEYKGTWNAATNTPTLANGTGDTGDVYICNVAGTVNFGAGPITFAVGDYVIYSGTIWQRSSGAVGTVTSVAASITGDSITISGSPVTTSGTLAFAFAGTGAQYIKGDGTLATFPTTIDQAKNLITEVYNSTGATLTKGTVVYINGGQGNLPTVTKALASGDSTSAQTYGIVQSDITNMNNGFVVVAGRLADIDTSAFSVGTQLYLSSTTAGAYTSTKQYAPAHLVYVGIIVRSHPTQGIIEVKIQNGYELDELHNVAAQTPTNNDGLFWESSTSLWKNKSIATVLGYTPANAATYVPYTGATANLDLGAFDLISRSAYLEGTASYQAGLLIKQRGLYNFVTGAYTQIVADSATDLNIVHNQANTTRRRYALSVAALQDGDTFQYLLPRANGTFALTSDLTGGTVTSVAALTIGTSGTDLSSTVANSTTTPVITLNVPTASATNRGALSSADWTTFNNKQNALTNPVTGTGTTNYIPKFTGTSAIGNSNLINDASGNLGLGVTPSASQDPILESRYGLFMGKDETNLLNNAYFNSGWKYSQTGFFANRYYQDGYSGGHQWLIAPSGTAGNAISFTQAMTLDASGRLGIGTTSPNTLLSLVGNHAGGQSILKIQSSTAYSSSGLSSIGFNDSDGSRKAIIYTNTNGLQLETGTATPIIFNPNGTTALTLANGGAATFTSSVTSNGNTNGQIAISPSTNTNAAAFTASNAGGGCYFGKNNSTGGAFTGTAYATVVYSGGDVPMAFYTNDAERMRITSGGNVGFNTSTPTTYSLSGSHIENYGGSNYAFIHNNTATVKSFLATDESAGLTALFTFSNHPLTFGTNNTERMRITSGGNVLINKTNTGSGIFQIKHTDANFYTGLSVYASTSDFFTTVGHTGSLGVISSTYNSSGSYTPLAFYTSDTERMRITSDGIVKLSTTSTITTDNNTILSYSPNGYFYVQGGSTGLALAGSGNRNNAILINSTDNAIYFQTNNLGTRMTLTSGGNLQLTNANPTIDFVTNTTTTTTMFSIVGAQYVGSAPFNANILRANNSSHIAFETGGSERMRITSGGDLLLGTTTDVGQRLRIDWAGGAGKWGMKMDASDGGAANLIEFLTAGNARGSITTNGTSVAYNTSSDYRLKQDLKDFNGLDLISKLKAYDYEWKVDKSRSYGVIAHELQSVINYAVTGVKDGEQMQGVDYSKIVPVLIKAIQELNDKIK